MRSFLRKLRIKARTAQRDLYIAKSKDMQKERLEGEIIRNVHSIEKGLSLKEPRSGFGVKKVKYIFSLLEDYKKCNKYDETLLYFIKDALKSYMDFHNNIGYSDSNIVWIGEQYDKFLKTLADADEKYAGIEFLSKKDMDFDLSQVENLFNTRHSIREFSGEPVDDDTIRKAVKLAQRAPSACNRQAVRVYSVSGKTLVNEIGASLEGMGGFVNDVDKFLMVTGKKSAYNNSEKNQYIVSAAIFSAYLSLTLHAYGIGNCVIQRPLSLGSGWEVIRKKYNIPADEQLVNLIAMGSYKDEMKVPMSKRLGFDKIYRNLDN